LRRAQALVDAAALPLDLWAGNLVLPMTQGQDGRPARDGGSGTRGQLRLHQPVLIDHAHTALAGHSLKRPMWLHAGMTRIPPELRGLLEQDQQALRATFLAQGATLPGEDAHATASARAQSQRLWAAYCAPQALQVALDSGRIDRAAAIEYAVGVALQQIVGEGSAASSWPDAAALQAVLSRMTSPNPSQRHGEVGAAAAALERALGTLPLVSHAHWDTVTPQRLSHALLRPATRTEVARPGQGSAGSAGAAASAETSLQARAGTAQPGVTARLKENVGPSTVLASASAAGSRQPGPAAPAGGFTRGFAHGLLWAAAGAGAACGMVWSGAAGF
jgi:uncharacterized membrane protein